MFMIDFDLFFFVVFVLYEQQCLDDFEQMVEGGLCDFQCIGQVLSEIWDNEFYCVMYDFFEVYL